MYKHHRIHSWLSPKCRVDVKSFGPSDANRDEGVIAIEAIEPYEIVAVWGGIVYTAEEISLLSESASLLATHSLQIADGFYLGPLSPFSCEDAEKFNHSCNPNAGIKGQVLVLSRRLISVGEEITIDYDTTDLGTYPIECICGEKECRRIIDGAAYRDAKWRERNKGWLSWFVEDAISKLG